jgi:ABC-type multidrug transport system ATPase subunit
MKFLEVNNISKSFYTGKLLENVSFTVNSGSIVAVTGENGVGKSTLLNIIIGWVKPDGGTIRISENFGFCPQEPLLFPRLTVNENLEYFRTAYGTKVYEKDKQGNRIDELLREFDFGGYRDKKVSILSGGTKQKLNLVISLLHDPDLMILDEPYASLDWDTYKKFWEYADARKKEGKSILIVSHFMYSQSMIDELYVIKDYKLVCA